MQRLLGTLLAAGLSLTTGCESEPAKPDKTAKADAKDDGAKAKGDDAKADDAKADDAKADDAKADDAANAEGDAKADDAADAEGDAKADDAAEGDDLDGYDPRVTQAARVAADISEDPQKADDVLAAADLDRDKLDALMYEIANDPDLTAQYRMARGI